MFRKKHWLIFCVVAIMALTMVFIAAGRKEEGEGQYVLAFTCPNLNPAYQGVLWGVRSEINDNPNIKLIVGAPELETDVAKQLNMIEDFIEKKVDAIALCTMADAVIENYIAKANEAGIPIIAYNTPALWPTGKIATNVGFDQREAGRVMARYALDNYLQDGGKVGIVEGMPGIFTDFRAGGIAEVLAEYPKVEIVSRQPADWDRVKATRVAENMMTAYPDLKAIFAICDEMGLGAAAAVVAAGKKEDIYVISHDGTLNGLQAVQDGSIDATVYINNIGWGVAIGEAFKKIVINGESVPETIYVDLPMADADTVAEMIEKVEYYEENFGS